MNLRKMLPASLLMLALVTGSAMPADAENRPATAHWVIDPAAPGDNLPPSGRSLFDLVFAVNRHGQAEIELPFPFDALLARLDSQLAHDPASPLPPAKRVLIPLGRSLQRTAAAPDYFSYPRVVVAVDSENGPNSQFFLKDRLYLGYQEKSAVLEIISYNEAAGRFEFQLVKDYRAGSKPRIYYANRSLCFACHQNGSPIFSRALWDETNANPQIASLLAANGRRFYGIAPERGIDIPYAIDNASERANRFALTQRLWREGCGSDTLAARRCRAGLFSAALRHALSGQQTWDTDGNFQQQVTAPLVSEARRRWPAGLAIGNPDLPNRNPLAGMTRWPADATAQAAYAHVAARFDTLLPRTPQEVWNPETPAAINAVIGNLAEFVSAGDRQRLESTLAKRTGVGSRQLTAPCRIATTTSRWSVQCAPVSGQAGPMLNASLNVSASQPDSGLLTRLSLPGGTALSNIELTPVGKATSGAASFTLQQAGRKPRTADGDALIRLTFRRTAKDPASGDVTLEIRGEFFALDQVISSLVESAPGEALFGAAPIPRTALFRALLARLSPGEAPLAPPANALPPPRLELSPAAPGSAASSFADAATVGFYPYCAACHQSAETFPPNFLTGSSSEVVARLRQCAPRIYIRLAMADLPAEQREKTPMPPQSMLPAFASDIASWRASPARAALLAEVSNWLRAESGQPPNLQQMLAGGYEALRPCLPQ